MIVIITLAKHYLTTSHFYHLGGKEENRNAVTEALIMNYDKTNKTKKIELPTYQQLRLMI
ncbi:MAG: hypothetical protein OHK0038_05480 [Flammeovirgaceae bacterium]